MRMLYIIVCPCQKIQTVISLSFTASCELVGMKQQMEVYMQNAGYMCVQSAHRGAHAGHMHVLSTIQTYTNMLT
jgi:hypothetical protein